VSGLLALTIADKLADGLAVEAAGDLGCEVADRITAPIWHMVSRGPVRTTARATAPTDAGGLWKTRPNFHPRLVRSRHG
jgi:hypothetical protein